MKRNEAIIFKLRNIKTSNSFAEFVKLPFYKISLRRRPYGLFFIVYLLLT